MKTLRKQRAGASVASAKVGGFADESVEALFPKQSPARNEGAELTVEAVHSRASETGDLLETILRTRGMSQRREWGLNE